MSTEELARPGVEVLQEFRTVTPSVITPVLPPCVVGVGKQIVEVLETNSAGSQQLNSDALITLPALLIAKAGTGTPVRYSGLHGLALAFSPNEAPDVTVTFSDPLATGLTPATVVEQVNDALSTAGVTSAVAETVGTDRWQLRTVGAGEFQTILISSGTATAVASAFEFGIGKTSVGLSSYNQYEAEVPPTAMPDPNSNLDELAVELSTIRSFLYTGSGVGLQEAKRDQSFLRKGSVAVKAATTEGTVDLSSDFPFFADEVLWVKVDGGETQIVTIPATINNSTQLLALLNGSSGFSGITASLGASNGLVLTHDTGGYAHTIQVLTPTASSAMTLLGLTAETVYGTSIEAVDDGNGDALTPLLKITGADFTAAAAVASLTGAGAPSLPPTAQSTLILSDGLQPQTITFDGTETTINDVIDAINAVMAAAAGGRLTASDSGGKLKFTHVRKGEESYVEVVGGTALSSLDSGSSAAATTEGTQSLNADSPAVTTEGTVNLASDAVIAAATSTFTLDHGGAGPYTVDLNTVSTWTALKALIDALAGGTEFVATRASGTTGGLVVTSVDTGAASDIVVADGTGGLAELGLTAETVTGADIFPTISTESFQVSIDGAAATTVTMAGTETSFANVKTTVEAALTGVTASQGVNGGLVMTGTTTGVTGTLQVIDNGGGGLALFGLTEETVTGGGETLVAGAKAYGDPFAPQPGDELWVDGTYYATINKVAPGSVVTNLRVDTQVAISSNVGEYYYIVAKGLVAGDSSLGVTRPYPDMQVDLEGNVVLKHNQLRDSTGTPISGKAPLYVAYSAVRQDVSPLASNPGLLRFDSTTALEQQLAPVSTSNPLALGLFFALINAPGVQVVGLGVDEISADAPYGTVDGFTRAAEYLEGYEVYALAPLTHDKSVAEVFNTHVNFMAEPESKGERIVLWNPDVPERDLDTLVASGTNGDGLTTLTFDTKVVNLSTLLVNAGVNPVGTIATSEGVFLDIAGDSKNYSVEEVNGGVVTIRTSFAAGDNTDGFYSTTALTLPIINEAFAIRVRGAELVTSTGQPDKAAIAATVSGLGQSFANRRFWMTFPDQAAATLDGLEQIVEGFYMNAAVAGMIAQQPPQQSFTNFPITGFTRVIGSNNVYSEQQLNQMAAGGAYIIVQDTEGGPLTARMALTTDMTSIETRTDSITKVVDFSAKFMRRGLRNFIGRFNITQGFLDTLGSVMQGLGGFLVETGVLVGLTLNGLVQDEDARDTVLVDTTLDPPYPCNYIRLTLVV